MSENKFTPGPWAIHEDQWVGIEVRSANANDLSELPGYYVLASSIGGHRYGDGFSDDSEVRANAALIAAAPEMYALLASIAARGDYECSELIRSIDNG